MAVDVTVQPVAENGEVTGFEYRCSFCTKVGVGYTSKAAALNDAERHRCQERAWNETRSPVNEFAHVATVEEQDDDTFDADCSCGWDDTGFEDREDAEVSIEEHLREVGV